ncbi:hypothetical protein LINPERPRIM_LOCUS19491 [Linum perenne]
MALSSNPIPMRRAAASSVPTRVGR